MRFEQLDLNLLVALDILLEEQNITRSSERLHLSQSATSGILSRLRAFFEDDLLVQIGKKMQPTPFALELQGPVAGVLATVRGSIIGRKANNPEQSERHFKIIASDYIIQVLLRHVLADVAQSAPGVTFEFLSPFAHEVNVLAKGGADIMMAPEAVMLDAYPNTPLVSDELVCIADINNKRVDKELTMEEFNSLGHISVGFARASHLSIEQWLIHTMETNRRVEVITNDFSTMIYTLLNTDRIAILPRHFAEMHVQREAVKIVKLPFETPKLKENMMWHPTLENDPMHRWLRQRIIDCAAKFA
ncbi:MAG: LysR family transcriptional regulator [Paraglaciecola sp.]|uniref:LysR family transcriptional regulator n=1 Tax=Paraglaciecola sp. TaxID=1920173 RepID=UPI00273E548D|nr:LysR family transcriptional regulator [Paraglaciecola sp.]MDP5029202.1 LysR family transcriptional regulator [Paraglaciecola sp.]MDP5129345.1 LysR family transcriptional regulator [Paraglaciecola sp.]